jgi:hypothetical protein
MERNLTIEEKIKLRKQFDVKHKINSYSGMNIDCCSIDEKNELNKEIDYMKKFPQLCNFSKPPNQQLYLIPLKNEILSLNNSNEY